MYGDSANPLVRQQQQFRNIRPSDYHQRLVENWPRTKRAVKMIKVYYYCTHVYPLCQRNTENVYSRQSKPGKARYLGRSHLPSHSGPHFGE